MNTVIKLMRMEWRKLLSIRSSLLIYAAMLLFCSLTTRASAFIFVFMIYLLTYTPLAYDEQSKGDYLLAALPVTRRQVVAAKYGMLVCEMAIMGAVIFIVNKLFCGFIFQPPSRELMSFASLGLLILGNAAFVGVLLPVALWLGVIRARYVSILLYGAFFGTIGVLFGLWGGEIPLENIIGNGWISIAIAAVLLFISYLVSVRLYERREFLG